MTERPVTAASFEEYLCEGSLMGTRCQSCGTLWCPPRPVCPSCGLSKPEWVRMSGKGTLASFTVIGVGTTMMLAEGYDRDNPYCAGIVQLEEGPRISAQILGIDASRPEAIRVGAPLELTFVERGSWAFSRELMQNRKVYPAFRAID